MHQQSPAHQCEQPKPPSGDLHADLAAVFGALGELVRMELVRRLRDHRERSISQLSEGLALTRQGVTKHLGVLHRAGVVSRRRVGRETRFQLQPDRLATAVQVLHSMLEPSPRSPIADSERDEAAVTDRSRRRNRVRDWRAW